MRRCLEARLKEVRTERVKSRFDSKKALLRLIVAMAVGCAGQVQAGFVDDFLDEAQANVNVTQSGIGVGREIRTW